MGTKEKANQEVANPSLIHSRTSPARPMDPLDSKTVHSEKGPRGALSFCAAYHGPPWSIVRIIQRIAIG